MDTSSTSSDAAKPEYDLRDWIVLALVAGGWVNSWAYVWFHPSEGTYAICIGATGSFGAIFHMLAVHDDKTPDCK